MGENILLWIGSSLGVTNTENGPKFSELVSYLPGIPSQLRWVLLVRKWFSQGLVYWLEMKLKNLNQLELQMFWVVYWQ